MPLTNIIIKNVKPEKKAMRLFDGRGLYLEVSGRVGIPAAYRGVLSVSCGTALSPA